MANIQIENSWKSVLEDEFEKAYFNNLTSYVRSEYRHHTCYPLGPDIFNAFNLCPIDKVKVVILGQDPYHGAGQAEGLCFSVKTGTALPPSLINIFKEVKNDVGNIPAVIRDSYGSVLYDGSLRRWAEQGVFLLNTCLTVREHEAFSHSRKGWEIFTDAVIKVISDRQENVVFMLWGGPARQKKKLIDTTKHLILESVHPSPLSANKGGWFGNHHFSKCNEWLSQHGREPIKW